MITVASIAPHNRRKRRTRRVVEQPVDVMHVGDVQVMTFKASSHVRTFFVDAGGRNIGWISGDARGRWRGHSAKTGDQVGTAYATRCRAIRALVKAVA